MEERSFDARVRKGDGMPTRDPVKSKRHRILVVDDPRLYRGLQLLMANQPDMEICGEAASVPEALRQLEANTPDVVICRTSLSKVAMGSN